jgi:hypothetical protein
LGGAVKILEVAEGIQAHVLLDVQEVIREATHAECCFRCGSSSASSADITRNAAEGFSLCRASKSENRCS